ncbi:hypothetical protein H2200_010249 [Cladophialophora chaetospira]|uniref:Uncharacterized protein n=1 Tax=Cladophialophora chaetospira TaxID=386627 RepID=A0AA38X2J6_9EURO|nr:hypothetical protein H2200_010249 [Cladophialophora chaetospira]
MSSKTHHRSSSSKPPRPTQTQPALPLPSLSKSSPAIAMSYQVKLGQAPRPSGLSDNPSARSPSPELSFDLAAAVARVSDPNRKTFFDLAPEIRIQIYRHLFQGQVIVIRGQDYVIKGKKKEKAMRYERDREIGLNMMLVNKTCLAEVKAVALSVAVFDINFTSMLKVGSPNYLRKQEQFGRPELSNLRAIRIPEFPRAVEGFVHQLSNMPFLHDVAWVGPKRIDYYTTTRLGPFDPDFSWDRFLDRLQSACGQHWSTKEAIKQHVKLAATRINKPARFVLEPSVLFSWTHQCTFYADVLEETVWVTGTWYHGFSTPKRVAPQLFGASE